MRTRSERRQLRCWKDRRETRRESRLHFMWNEKHKEYIRKCVSNTYNIAEGAVRAGKTVDNVYAFAHELKTHPDKMHLATGSTGANAKLNIGDCNGMGLEYIFAGQCHWGKYKGNECLIINGPDTGHKEKIVIFAGAALASSYKKIRGETNRNCPNTLLLLIGRVPVRVLTGDEKNPVGRLIDKYPKGVCYGRMESH